MCDVSTRDGMHVKFVALAYDYLTSTVAMVYLANLSRDVNHQGKHELPMKAAFAYPSPGVCQDGAFEADLCRQELHHTLEYSQAVNTSHI